MQESLRGLPQVSLEELLKVYPERALRKFVSNNHWQTSTTYRIPLRSLLLSILSWMELSCLGCWGEQNTHTSTRVRIKFDGNEIEIYGASSNLCAGFCSGGWCYTFAGWCNQCRIKCRRCRFLLNCSLLDLIVGTWLVRIEQNKKGISSLKTMVSKSKYPKISKSSETAHWIQFQYPSRDWTPYSGLLKISLEVTSKRL